LPAVGEAPAAQRAFNELTAKPKALEKTVAVPNSKPAKTKPNELGKLQKKVVNYRYPTNPF